MREGEEGMDIFIGGDMRCHCVGRRALRRGDRAHEHPGTHYVTRSTRTTL